jgi:hypothetical protein
MVRRLRLIYDWLRSLSRYVVDEASPAWDQAMRSESNRKVLAWMLSLVLTAMARAFGADVYKTMRR